MAEKKIDKMYFLIVDKEIQMRTLIKSVIKSLGSRSITSSNGKDAIRKIESPDYQIDFVITAWDMPYLNGLELLKYIREKQSLFKMPVLMCSTEKSTQKILTAMEEGVDGYIIAPFTGKKLLKSIELIVNKRKNPTKVKAKVDEMKLHKIKKDYKQVLQAGSKISSEEVDPEYYILVAESLYVLQEYDKAIKVIQTILKKEENSKALHLAGKVSLALEKIDESIRFFKKSIELNPADDSKKIDLIIAYFQAEMKVEAEQLVNDIKTTDPTEIVLTEIADIYINRDELDKAGELLEIVSNPIPKTIHVFNNYATKLAKAKRNDESIKQFTKCMKCVPNSFDVHLNAGFVFSKLGKYSDAKRVLTVALKQNPSSSSAKILYEFVKDK